MFKQTSYAVLPPDGSRDSVLVFSTKKRALEAKGKLQGSSIFDVVIYTDDSLNTGRRENVSVEES